MYQLYFWCKRILKQRKEDCVIDIVLRKIVDYIEAYYNLFVVKQFRKQRKYGVTKKEREERIIVSLTSYPKRIGTVWITIETLMRQSMKPDKIILWLAKEQFKNLDELPQELREQQERGLTIRFCDDLKSHKKYYYVLQEYSKDIVILVDDDMFYPYDTIKKLYCLHRKRPHDICCITSQVITPSFSSPPSLWRNPNLNERIEGSERVQIFTGSGSLFVPKALSEEVFDKALLMKLCPYADDLWVTFMAYRKGTKITSLRKWRAFPITIYGTNEGSLWYVNGQDGKNDEQWMKLKEFYLEEFEKQEKKWGK